MKFTLKIPLVLGVLYMAGSAVPMQAQFVVADPGSYAYYAQMVVQAVATIQQDIQLYNTIKQDVTMLQHRQFMQAASYLAHASIPGQPGWTIAFQTAAGPLQAAGVWQQMLSPSTSLQSRITLADSFGAGMIDAIGGCSAAADNTNQAVAGLENFALSLGGNDNSHNALAGGTNMGLTQQIRISQCQQSIQQQQAQAQMLQMMRQRDQDNAQLTTYQNITAIAARNPRGMVNLSALNLADLQ